MEGEQTGDGENRYVRRDAVADRGSRDVRRDEGSDRQGQYVRRDENATRRVELTEEDLETDVGRWNRLLNMGLLGAFWTTVLAVLFTQPLWLTVVVGGVAVLSFFAAFEIRGESVLSTSKPPRTVSRELASVCNPVTETWVDNADVVHNPGEGDEASAILVTSTLFGLVTQEYALDVLEGPDDSIRIEIRKGDTTYVEMDLSVDPAGERTHVELSSFRGPISAFELAILVLSNPLVERQLRRHEYRTEEESMTVGLRSSGD